MRPHMCKCIHDIENVTYKTFTLSFMLVILILCYINSLCRVNNDTTNLNRVPKE
jgi:hypothetical protein